MSMNPGASTRPDASIPRSALSASWRSGWISVICSPSMKTSAVYRGVSVPSTTAAERIRVRMGSEVGADEVDDGRIIAAAGQDRDPAPLVEGRARVRKAQPYNVTDLQIGVRRD